MNRPSLELRQTTTTTLTPELRRNIQLLQLSATELQQELLAECESNPFVELDIEADEVHDDFATEPDLSHTSEDYEKETEEDFAPQSTVQDLEDMAVVMENDSASDLNVIENQPEADWEEIYTSSSGSTGTGEGVTLESDTASLQQHLLDQLKHCNLSHKQLQVTQSLIDALNEDGLLLNWSEICEELRSNSRTSQKILDSALNHLQSLSPEGVGARTVQECLLLQLKERKSPSDALKLATNIVHNHFNALVCNNLANIQAQISVSDNELNAALVLIRSLNPRPGASFVDITTSYVVPDVVVRKSKNEWVVTLNDEFTPNIRINRHYQSLISTTSSKTDKQYLRKHLHQAQALLYGLSQRKKTLIKTATAIVELQRGFFDHGPLNLQPMVQAEVANHVGIHASTVSRITTGKFLSCPRGVFSLKYFFSSPVRSRRGHDVSSSAVRALIKEWTQSEDPVKPLTDTTIVKLLAERQISIARRTVTKYREELNIPRAQHRRRANPIN